MHGNSVIYCDESGNDGPNYLNRDEPFYVLGGWIVPDSVIVNASVEMEQLRQARCPTAPELKFRMFRNTRLSLFESMCRLGKIGLVPIFVVAEKRYCVAGKIIETFLDPYFNASITARFSGDLTTKQELANTLYGRLSDKSLQDFANAYRNPTQLELERALTQILNDCRACVNPEVAELLSGSIDRLDEVAQEEVTAVTSWGKAMGTLNLPCLIAFLMLVEELGRQDNTNPKRIVHDEQGPYQNDYVKAFKVYRESDEDERVLINGMRVPYGALRRIDEFEFQRSVDQPLIQAADLLAGSVAHLSKALIQGGSLTPQEVELGGLFFPALFVHEVALAMPICSDHMLRQFGRAISLAYPVESGASRDSSELQFRWTSTLPNDGPLPILPPIKDVLPDDRTPDKIVRVTLPIYGLENSSKQLVVLLPPDVTFEQTSVEERSLPLWTRRELAESFLAEQEWHEPHRVVEFGPREARDLINRLREQSRWTQIVVFNLFDDDAAPYPIERLAGEMEQIIERIERACESGIANILVDNHDIEGQRVVSLLLSSGEYGAMCMSDGLIAIAKTREDALAQLSTLMK